VGGCDKEWQRENNERELEQDRRGGKKKDICKSRQGTQEGGARGKTQITGRASRTQTKSGVEGQKQEEKRPKAVNPSRMKAYHARKVRSE